jgi:post-segregation antitoxin (ccd killing protein)
MRERNFIKKTTSSFINTYHYLYSYLCRESIYSIVGVASEISLSCRNGVVMGMGSLTVYVDRDYVELAKAKRINISQEVNEFLKNRLNINEPETIEEQFNKTKTEFESIKATYETKIKTLELQLKKSQEPKPKKKEEIKKEKFDSETKRLLKQSEKLGIRYDKSESK